MTNYFVLSNTLYRAYAKPVIEQPVKQQCLSKPHELYDGVVFVVWAIGFLVASKCLLNICQSVKTLIQIK